MKKIFAPFLFISLLMLGLVSCSEENEQSSRYYYDGPAIVKKSNGSPLINTPSGLFSVPELSGEPLEPGSCLWTYFIVDSENPATSDVRTASDFQYKPIGKSNVIMPTDKGQFDELMSGSYYPESIESADLYPSDIEKVLFFGFTQTAPAGQTYSYVMICNPEIEAGTEYPTLYIRSMKTNQLMNVEPQKIVTHYGFDMNEFVKKYRIENTVTFNLKYKTDTKDQKDIYKSFQSNPIPWTFN